jgi:hypothetical protein
MGFLVDNEALGQILLGSFRLSPMRIVILPMFHTHFSYGTDIVGPSEAAVLRDSLSLAPLLV